MGEISLPDLTVLQLVFGYRSLDELRAAHPDCYVDKEEAGFVLSTLFPQRSSLVPGIT